MTAHPAKYFSMQPDGRLLCELCPRDCTLKDGQRGLCFVRQRQGDAMVLTTYGRSSGFCVDPIEKKPLNHFHPGSSVLSFGTAGCNLACKFCQNWDISKSREMDKLASTAGPAEIARAAKRQGCTSVAFTYNDPVIFIEYAIDCAEACRALGIKTVAVTAGYIHDRPRRDFFAAIDAANVDLKAFTESFYYKLTSAHLAPVLETLEYLVNETEVWTEITTLVIPGHNDSDEELHALSNWVADKLGPNVPLHFSAFHPDYRMKDVPRTELHTLQRARSIAKGYGLRYVYTGNVHDPEGDQTICPGCGAVAIARDWYEVQSYQLDTEGQCSSCGETIAGRFGAAPGTFGRRRLPVTL